MEPPVPRWIRVGVSATLAVPQVLIGLWAVVAPHSWFTSFPGFGPRLIAAEPPYNRHLASDAGAGFLATGVVLLVAVMWANRTAVLTALVAYAAFTAPHVLYHAVHPADALSGVTNVLDTLSIATGLGLALLYARGTLAVRERDRDARQDRSPAPLTT